MRLILGVGTNVDALMGSLFVGSFRPTRCQPEVCYWILENRMCYLIAQRFREAFLQKFLKCYSIDTRLKRCGCSIPRSQSGHWRQRLFVAIWSLPMLSLRHPGFPKGRKIQTFSNQLNENWCECDTMSHLIRPSTSNARSHPFEKGKTWDIHGTLAGCPRCSVIMGLELWEYISNINNMGILRCSARDNIVEQEDTHHGFDRSIRELVSLTERCYRNMCKTSFVSEREDFVSVVLDHTLVHILRCSIVSTRN